MDPAPSSSSSHWRLPHESPGHSRHLLWRRRGSKGLRGCRFRRHRRRHRTSRLPIRRLLLHGRNRSTRTRRRHWDFRWHPHRRHPHLTTLSAVGDRNQRPRPTPRPDHASAATTRSDRASLRHRERTRRTTHRTGDAVRLIVPRGWGTSRSPPAQALRGQHPAHQETYLPARRTRNASRRLWRSPGLSGVLPTRRNPTWRQSNITRAGAARNGDRLDALDRPQRSNPTGDDQVDRRTAHRTHRSTSMSFITAPGAIPTTYAREEPACGRCPKCHPGKSYPASFCRVDTCACHRRRTE